MLRTPNKLVCAAFHFQLELSFPSVTLGQIQELSNRLQVSDHFTDDRRHISPLSCKTFSLLCTFISHWSITFFIKPLLGFILSLCLMSSFHKAALDYPVDKHFTSSTSYWT